MTSKIVVLKFSLKKWLSFFCYFIMITSLDCLSADSTTLNAMSSYSGSSTALSTLQTPDFSYVFVNSDYYSSHNPLLLGADTRGPMLKDGVGFSTGECGLGSVATNTGGNSYTPFQFVFNSTYTSSVDLNSITISGYGSPAGFNGLPYSGMYLITFDVTLSVPSTDANSFVPVYYWIDSWATLGPTLSSPVNHGTQDNTRDLGNPPDDSVRLLFTGDSPNVINNKDIPVNLHLSTVAYLPKGTVVYAPRMWTVPNNPVICVWGSVTHGKPSVSNTTSGGVPMSFSVHLLKATGSSLNK